MAHETLSASMGPSNCFAALSQYRKVRMTETIPAVQSGHQIQQLPLTEISGEEIATRFADEAYKTLEQHELN